MNLKETRTVLLIATLLLIISAFLPWRIDVISEGMIYGWNYLFSEPLLWNTFVLFIAGTFGLIFTQRRRFGIFSVFIGLLSIFFLLNDMRTTLRLTQQPFSMLYRNWFLLSLVISIVIMGLTIWNFLLLKKMSGEKSKNDE